MRLLLAKYLLLLMFTVLNPFNSTAQQQKTNSKPSDFTQVVKDILAGQNAERCKSFIDPFALVVHGGTVDNLLGVVSGTTSHYTLNEQLQTQFPTCVGKECVIPHGVRRLMSYTLRMTGEGNAAFMLLTTHSGDVETRKYHSVFLLRSKDEDWKIANWHTSP